MNSHKINDHYTDLSIKRMLHNWTSTYQPSSNKKFEVLEKAASMHPSKDSNTLVKTFSTYILDIILGNSLTDLSYEMYSSFWLRSGFSPSALQFMIFQ
ncbi:MAG: hypothetical protein JXA19_07490 [Anaerolineales bacterium]|nr:hypothetical protein [Anaerolineales bacterium]